MQCTKVNDPYLLLLIATIQPDKPHLLYTLYNISLKTFIRKKNTLLFRISLLLPSLFLLMFLRDQKVSFHSVPSSSIYSEQSACKCVKSYHPCKKKNLKAERMDLILNIKINTTLIFFSNSFYLIYITIIVIYIIHGEYLSF